MSRLPLLLTSALLGTVLLAGLPAAPTTASTAVPPSTAAPVSAASAAPGGKTSDPPLVAASKALQGAPADPRDRPEATLALRDLFLARPTLDDLGSQFAGGLLARPTAGTSDPFTDGYSLPATRRCSRHFCLHWVVIGTDAPATVAWPATTLRLLEKVWRHHVDVLGYRPPASDNARGGNAKFDVYLKDVGSRGLYGYCAPERRVSGEPKQASGFCVLDNDFARTQFGRSPKQSLKVTAAHEFFHAIQFAYDFTEDPWLLESSATWMEEQFADGVNDNRAYLRFGQLARPRVPLDLFEPSGYAHYGNWTFWDFLGRRFGTEVVRKVWERAGTGRTLPDDFSAQALRTVLATRGGLPRSFAAYAAANTIPAATYPEGAGYPSSPVAGRRLGPDRESIVVRARLDHLTSRSVRMTPDPALSRGTRLAIDVDGPDRSRAAAAHVLVVRADGTLMQRSVRLDAGGAGRVVVLFDPTIRSVTVALANGSTRYRCGQGTTLSCTGRALDAREKIELRASLTR